MDKILLLGIMTVCLLLATAIVTFPLRVLRKEKDVEMNYMKFGYLIVNNSQKQEH